MAPNEGADDSRAVLTVRGPLSPTSTRAMCEQVQILLLAERYQEIVCEVSGKADLTVIDALARLALLTRRADVRFQIEAAGDTCESLGELAVLTGLEWLDQRRVQELEARRQAKTCE